jgi:uncharacterized membrane protein YphA (DoxX/SURF4 family)
MWNDASVKNSLVPFILRLALAAIFIYHGWHKVADHGNEWGTLWASNLAYQSYSPPEHVLQRLDQFDMMEKERHRGDATKDTEPPERLSDRVRGAYAKLSSPEFVHQHPDTSVGLLQLNSSVQLLVAWGELLGGIALLLGLLTRLAALGLIVIQVGAICTVTFQRGFAPLGGAGYEYNVALIAMCVALFLLGSGALAVDRRLWRRRAAPAAPAEQSVPVPA